MENKECEPLPKKDRKSIHLVIGIIIGAVIATVIILVVLFATGIIGGKGSEENSTFANKPEVTKTDLVSNGKNNAENKNKNNNSNLYCEFILEDVLFVQENSIGEQKEEYKTLTIQVPYIEEYSFLGLDINSLEIDLSQSACGTNGKIFICELEFLKNGISAFALEIIYSGDTFSYDNVLAMTVDSSVVSYNGQERWVDCLYLGPDKLLCTERGIDDEFVYRCTSSGYEYKDGTYYNNHGDIINEEEYEAEEEKVRNEAFTSFKKYL